MAINSININNDDKYYDYQNTTGADNQIKEDNSSFSLASNPFIQQDSFETSASTASGNDRIAALKISYQKAKEEQGIIGDVADLVKNIFHTKNCSNNIEDLINSLNENSTEEDIQAVEERLEKYNSNQDSAVKGVSSAGAMMAGGAIGSKAGAAIGTAICPGLGTVGGFICGIVVGAIAGALTSIGINQIENMTDSVKGNSWQNDENLLLEAGEGALSGGSAVLMGGITQKVTGAVASKAGLVAKEVGGKTALVALAEDGKAKVGSTVAKNALANAIGSGTAATVVADGEYLLECAMDENKDFSLTDFGTTTVTSFGFGSTIGGISGGIQGYKGATSYNTLLHKEQIQAEVQARIEAESEAKKRVQQAQEEYNKPFEENLSNKSAEESAKFFEAQGKSEYEIYLDEQEALALKNNGVEVRNQTPQVEHKLSERSLKLGTSCLAEEGSPEYEALYNTAKESFVVVRSKEEAMEIYRKQFASVDVQGDDIFVLNPSDPAKVAKKINTSNEYNCQWFAEANKLDGKVVNFDTIQEAISQCQSKNITIFVPDDCAVSGSSLILNTTKTLNNLSIPEGMNIQLIYSPMIQSSTAEQGFSALCAFDIGKLEQLKILSSTHNDIQVMQSFIDKFGEHISISVAQGGIKTTPFYNSEYFVKLQQESPEVADAVKAILTNNGAASGFGRPGQSGVMIAMPNADGVLKCPNNNPYNAAPYALAEGATPNTIKSPTGKNIAKWHTRLQKILDSFNDKVA